MLYRSSNRSAEARKRRGGFSTREKVKVACVYTYTLYPTVVINERVHGASLCTRRSRVICASARGTVKVCVGALFLRFIKLSWDRPRCHFSSLIKQYCEPEISARDFFFMCIELMKLERTGQVFSSGRLIFIAGESYVIYKFLKVYC